MRRRVERLKEQGAIRRAACAHPCADRAADRRGVAAGDRGRHHGRDHQPPAPHRGGDDDAHHRPAGASPRRAGDEVRRSARRARPKARSRCIRSARTAWCSRRARWSARPRSPRSKPRTCPRSWWRGSSRAMSRRTSRPPRSPPRSRAKACMSTAPSPAAPICSPSMRACWWSTGEGVDALNDVDPAITFATLDAYAPVVAGKMIATVKIIPFAVAGEARDRARRGGARRKADRARRAVPGAQGRHHLDACCPASPTR